MLAPSAETGGTAGAYKKVVHAKSEEAIARIQAATENSPLFTSVGPAQRKDLIDAMMEVHCQPGQIVIQQGDVGDNFYVVDSGEYSVLLKQNGNQPVRTKEGELFLYRSGGTFGELSLMYNSPRAATVRCEAAGALFALDRQTFRALMMEANQSTLNTSTSVSGAASFLRAAVPTLPPYPLCYRRAAFACARSVARALTGTALPQPLPPCRRAAAPGLPRQLVCATAPLFTVHAPALPAHPPAHEPRLFLIVALGARLRWQFLKSVSMLSPLTDEQRQAIADILEEVPCKAGTVIVREGDVADSLFFVKEGAAAAFKKGPDGAEKQVFEMQPGSVFGESALQGANSLRQATVKAVSDVKMLKLTRAK